MENRPLTIEEKHAFALSHGLWQCPACPNGWQQYLIARDMNVCAVCGYKGGPVLPQKLANADTAAA